MTDCTTGNGRLALQEYLKLLNDAECSSDEQVRNVKLLRAWGVAHYSLSGSAKCEHCGVEVRLAIPVSSENSNGDVRHYSCLCTNCTFKVLESSRHIVIQVGPTSVKYSRADMLA